MRKIKESGVAWIGSIPSNWTLYKMKHIGRYINGYAFKPEDWSATGLPIIRIQDLTGSNDNPNFYNGQLPEKYHIYNGDILVSWAATLSAFVWDKGEGWLNQHIFKAIPDEKIMDCNYYFWLLKTAMAYMNDDNKHGIMMQHVTLPVFNNFIVPIPPKAQQRTVAVVLDKKIRQIDALIANVQTQIEKLQAYKQSLITEVVTRGLDPSVPMKDSSVEWIGKIPTTWTTIRVKQLLSERKERSVDGSEEPLSMSQKFGLVPTKDLNIIPNMASSFVGAKLAYVNDLVFNKLKAHLGVFSVSRYNGLVSPDYAVYRSTGKINLKYLEYLFKTPQCISEFRKRSTGIAAGLTRLYTDGLFAIECPFPPAKDQENIVEYLNAKCAQIDRLSALKQAKIDKLNEYKKSLIYEYVTGKKEA